jgi:hypothetical protein
MAPPRSIYFGSTLVSVTKEVLSVNSQAQKHTMRAESWTKALATQILDDFVTPVLKTPCTLINAPEIIAIKNPTISESPYVFIRNVSCMAGFYT